MRISDWSSDVCSSDLPVQDIDRINKSGQAKVQIGPELRTIFFGFDTARDELVYSNVKGKNPFKDKRVRQAFYQAIDDRKSVVEGKSVSVRVDLGGRRLSKKKKSKDLACRESTC